MIKTQKIIKYCAIVFALYLIFNIIFGILYGVMSIDNIFSSDDNVGELNNVDIDISDVNYLEIDLNSINLDIKIGEEFKVETNSTKINVSNINNKLVISDKSKWFFDDSDRKVILYIPNDFEFDKVNIETGAGKVNIDELNSKKLSLDLGAGKVIINELSVINKAEIETGAGEFVINNGLINNLDMDMGVGKVYIKALINGESEMDAGVGKTTLDLVGSLSDYKIKIDKGIGNTKINGDNITDGKYYGTGSNVIDIDGGVGEFVVNFFKE